MLEFKYILLIFNSGISEAKTKKQRASTLTQDSYVCKSIPPLLLENYLYYYPKKEFQQTWYL